MVTRDFKSEQLSSLEMSKLSSQEMAVTFGGYLYGVTVYGYVDGFRGSQGFLFDSTIDYQEQYDAFQWYVEEELHDYLGI